MKPNFDYDSSPYNFAHCLNTDCLRAEACLRRQMALRIPLKRATVTVVNPAHTTPTGENCPNFKADSTLRFARGMTHLLDHVPHNDALLIKEHLLSYFGRTQYYRLWRKERLFSPDQQEYIRQLFRKRGLSEAPVFDEYVEVYDW